MHHMVFRALQRRDWPMVLGLAHRAFPNLPLEVLSYQLRTQWRNARVVMGEHDKVMGFWLADPNHGAEVAWLEFIAVHPDYKGQRLGQALLEDFEAFAGARGLKVLKLAVDADNSGAIALYERLGWSKAPSAEVGRFAYQKHIVSTATPQPLRSPTRVIQLFDRVWFWVMTSFFQSSH